MVGNILSVCLWVGATDFRTFITSRIVGGLSEGNVQLANAIITDISDEQQRGSAMALVGACFNLAFTCGPVLGATLASVNMVTSNKFAVAAGVSLVLVVIETVYIYFSLQETHPRLRYLQNHSSLPAKSSHNDKFDITTAAVVNGGLLIVSTNGHTASPVARQEKNTKTRPRNTFVLNVLHLVFLLPFSGLEFSLPFLTTTLYSDQAKCINPSALNGRLLSLMGLIASLLQGTVVRRLPPIMNIRIGVVACAISFFLLARVSSIKGVYVAGIFLAITSATVVTGINSLGSLMASEDERGLVLGRLRSWGQVGRAVGSLFFCSLFWWVGRGVAYTTGGVMMMGVAVAAFTILQSPQGSG
jgi:predicted MFS family arabinose efflux permease